MSACPTCGDEIPPKKVGQVGKPKIYCSIRCRSAAQKQREARGQAWDRSPRPCGQCGGLFDPQTEHHAFCSTACRKKHENIRRFKGSGTNSNYYRTAFLEERGGVCERCGVPDGLELHHIVSVAEGGSHKASNLLVICEDCHKDEHKRRLAPEAKRSPEVKDNPHVPQEMREKAERELLPFDPETTIAYEPVRRIDANPTAGRQRLTKPPLQRPIVQKREK